MSTWSIASLNPVQRKIVEHKTGPALVIAGAGSGKTRVITHRVAQLIHSGIPASSILLLTFTNKAANEMAQRVGRALKNSTEQQKIIHGTFHSVGSRFLRRNAKLLNYNNNFSILDSSDSRDLIKASLAETVGKPGKYFPKAAVLQNMFSLAFNRFCTQKMILDQPYHERSFHLEQLISADFPNFEENTETILNILAAYRHKKKRGQVMDFDDLLENWLELLLRHGEGLPLCRQIQYILVDEYQDTNQVQANILYRLSRPHKNLMVVGDDAQSIYSWRGADFGNMLEFPERYQAVTYNMEENYRSSPEILDAANRSINYNTRQFEKNLFSSLAEGEKPLVHHVWASQDEAELILEKILSFRDEDISLNEMSVLYRNHVQSAALQVVLTHAGIPFVVHSGVKFFEQAHIKDVTAFLKVLFNPLDENAWTSLLGNTSGKTSTSNSSLSLIWENYGLGFNQMSFKTTSSKNNVYEMKNSSLDLSYTLDLTSTIVEDWSATAGLGYVYEGKGSITSASSAIKYETESVSGFGLFGLLGMVWEGLEGLIGVRYYSTNYTDFKSTNTSEVLSLGKPYSISDTQLIFGQKVGS